MNWRELAELLSLLQPEIKVLYMSGYTDDDIVHRGSLDSNITFLQKPFTLIALASAVREVLSAGKK
jgi:two-component system cell cycle sensor histidine kinase/response regulator CckA